MAPSSNQAFVSAALLLITASYAINQDHRYPNYILEANTPCTQRGVFSHPTNCSWFYRCDDKMVDGFYHKYLFECAPGTVFDDALDVCVLKSHSNVTCGAKDVPTSGCLQTKEASADYCYPQVGISRDCTGKPGNGGCSFHAACSLEIPGLGYIQQFCRIISKVDENNKCEAKLTDLCSSQGLVSVRTAP